MVARSRTWHRQSMSRSADACGLIEIRHQMRHHLTRIVLDPVNERGLPPSEHRQSKRVHAGTLDDTAVVPQVTFLVNDRHVQPAVDWTETRGPDHRTDLAALEIDLIPRSLRHA